MALRTKYSNLDMVRMGKFAKENPDLKPVPLIKAYCEKYPEISQEQKFKNLKKWFDENGLLAAFEDSKSTKNICKQCGNELCKKDDKLHCTWCQTDW